MYDSGTCQQDEHMFMFAIDGLCCANSQSLWYFKHLWVYIGIAGYKRLKTIIDPWFQKLPRNMSLLRQKRHNQRYAVEKEKGSVNTMKYFTALFLKDVKQAASTTCSKQIPILLCYRTHKNYSSALIFAIFASWSTVANFKISYFHTIFILL